MLARSNYMILSDAILLSEGRWVVQRFVQVDLIVKVVVYTLPVGRIGIKLCPLIV